MAALSLSFADISNDGPTDVILLVARMQPPTPAHKMLIEKVVAEAIKMINAHKTPTIRIILSANQKTPLDNPLDCRYKATLVDQLVRDAIGSHNIQYVIDCTDNIYGSVVNALEEYKWGVWFAGTDRVDDYNKMIKSINKYFVKTGKASAMIEVKELTRSDEDMSATYIRELVCDRKKKKFMKEMAPTGIADLEELYTRLETGLQRKSEITNKAKGTRKRSKRSRRNRKTKKQTRSRKI